MESAPATLPPASAPQQTATLVTQCSQTVPDSAEVAARLFWPFSFLKYIVSATTTTRRSWLSSEQQCLSNETRNKSRSSSSLSSSSTASYCSSTLSYRHLDAGGAGRAAGSDQVHRVTYVAIIGLLVLLCLSASVLWYRMITLHEQLQQRFAGAAAVSKVSQHQLQQQHMYGPKVSQSLTTPAIYQFFF